MDEALTRDPLVPWALGSLHATLFLGAFVLTFHLLGTAGAILGVLDTLRGFALFAALWLVSLWSARRALAQLPPDAHGTYIVGRGAFWGGVTGVGFLLALVGLVLVPGVVEEGVQLLPFLVIFAGIGSLAAFLVGALVGVVLALLDVALFALATRIR